MTDINQQRTYLAVPFEGKDEASNARAVFDPNLRCWYATPNSDFDKLRQWLPSHTVTPIPNPAHLDFADALRSIGAIDVDESHPNQEKKQQRFQVYGDKGRKQSGSYTYCETPVPWALIINHRTGQGLKWDSYQRIDLSSEQRTLLNAQLAQAAWQHQLKQELLYSRTAEKLTQHLRCLSPAHQTPYLTKKHLHPMPGLFVRESITIIPGYDIHGKLWTFQSIHEDGTKLFTKQSKKMGCFHLVGQPNGSLTSLYRSNAIIIAEGYATAASIHSATRLPTIAAFDSGNLLEVAKAFRARFPDKPIVIAGDDDAHLIDHPHVRKNVGKEKALQAAQFINGLAVFPQFSDHERATPGEFTDFNDMARGQFADRIPTLFHHTVAEAQRQLLRISETTNIDALAEIAVQLRRAVCQGSLDPKSAADQLVSQMPLPASKKISAQDEARIAFTNRSPLGRVFEILSHSISQHRSQSKTISY
jgi:putative DNA primase/helicase